METIGGSFTILDFMEAFRELFPNDWGRIVERYGLYGSKRRYTVATYLSNGLYTYSHKPHSTPEPLVKYTEDRTKSFRRATDEEGKGFREPLDSCLQEKIKARMILPTVLG